MNQPHDPNLTAPIPESSAPPDSLGPGLAAAFGQPTEAPRSSFGAGLKPVVLPDAAGESSHIVKTQSDALPKAAQAGDRYQLSGEIARGGMGAVLRGRDVDLGRDLAIKVLLEKHAQRPEIARRFLEEAQIGGQLQHPGVVPVYDIGRFGELPFFTMKLVKGKTLAEVLAERKDLANDRPRLLGIALQVSQTLAYAHAKGVIHRDLKPANIMVGSFGEVQVMDWGLAKVLASGGVADEEKASRLHQEAKDETNIKTARSAGSNGSFGTDTEAGSLLGTPAYMPPEQANGDVTLMDRRADVFGLGAILCEILTGKPPYVGRSQEEVRRKAANGDLTDAYSRLAESAADKELITLTRLCLSPEPMDRPKDAQAVAESLSGYLDGVQARLRQAELAQAAATAKAIEETKRRKVTMALAALVVAIIGFGGAGYLWYKADHDARVATLNREVNFALNQANTLREEAKTATAGNATRLSQAKEQIQRALALVQTGQVDGELVRQVHSLKAELDEGEKDRKLVADLEEARLAQAGQGTEDVFLPNALPLFREAFEAYGLPIGKEPASVVAERLRQKSPAIQEAILSALLEWKQIVENPNFHLEEPHLKWIVSLIDDLEPRDGWRRKVWITAEEKDQTKRQEMLEKLAEGMDGKNTSAAGMVFLAGQIKGPGRVKVLRKAQMLFPGDFWVNQNLGASLLGKPYSDPPDHGESIRFHTAAVALRPESPHAFTSLGNALRLGKRHEEAIANYRMALSLNPNDWIAHINLGNALSKKGLLEEALLHYQKAANSNQKIGAKYIPYWHIGYVYNKEKKYNLAIENFQKSIELNPKFASTHIGLGNVFMVIGQVEKANSCYLNALKIDPKNAIALFNLGIIFREKKQFDQAIEKFREAIKLDPKLAPAHTNLGLALKAKGSLDEAIACHRKGIELDPKVALAHTNLGVALQGKGLLDEAIASHRKAIELDPNLSSAHNNLGIALADTGQVDAAIACYRKAIELDPKYAETHCNLGRRLPSQGRFTESLAALKRGHELGSKNPGWRYPSAEWVRQAEANAAMEAKLPAFLKGEFQPSDNEERLGLAAICQFKKLNHAAADLYSAAFAADPKLASNMQAQHRYNAACHAALAAAGQGEDATKLDDAAKAKLRGQARDWLTAELAAWAKLLESDSPQARPMIMNTLGHWQKDADLSCIRDPAALAKLPAAEQKAFTQLWADVAALLKKAENPATKEDKK